ncbi:MAG: hypothetical protein AAFY65_12525 [Pseudomonadota bacterium]
MSGSRDTGRGLAWAIPMDVLVGDGSLWERLDVAVSGYRWPDAGVLVPGVSFGRSQAKVTPLSISAKCRAATAAMQVAYDNTIKVNAVAAAAFDTLLRTVTQNGRIPKEDVPDNAIRYASEALNTMPQLAEVQASQDQLTEAWTTFLWDCSGPHAMDRLRASYPATQHNIRALAAMIDRLDIVSPAFQEGNLYPEDVAEVMGPVVAMLAQSDQTLSQQILVMAEALVQLRDTIDEEQAHARATTAYGREMADFLALVETGLDEETEVYREDVWPFALTLPGGWVPADPEMFGIVADDRSVPSNMPPSLAAMFVDGFPLEVTNTAYLYMMPFPARLHGTMTPDAAKDGIPMLVPFLSAIDLEVAEVLAQGEPTADGAFYRYSVLARPASGRQFDFEVTGWLPAAPVPVRGMLICLTSYHNPRRPCETFSAAHMP